MRSINSHSSFLPLPSSHQKLKQQQQQLLKTPTKLLSLSTNEPTSRLQHRPNINLHSLPPPLRTQAATTSSLVLSVIDSPAAKSGDVSVFLQTSAVLFFAYWITNFVVPDIISNYLQLKKVSDDDEEKSNDITALEDEKSSKLESSMRRSQAKKRGFNSTKP